MTDTLFGPVPRAVRREPKPDKTVKPVRRMTADEAAMLQREGHIRLVFDFLNRWGDSPRWKRVPEDRKYDVLVSRLLYLCRAGVHKPERATFSTIAYRAFWMTLNSESRRMKYRRRAERLFTKDGEDRGLAVTLADVAAIDSEEEGRVIVDDLLAETTERRELVLRMLYGIGCRECSHEEVADKLGVSVGVVERVEQLALGDIRGDDEPLGGMFGPMP